MKKHSRAKHISNAIRFIVFLVSAIPFIWLVLHYKNGTLGLNPFESIMAITGHSSLIFLVLTLAITPMRRWLIFAFTFFPSIKWGKRLADWNVLIKLRRMLGIYSFFYASLHMLAYFELELSWIWQEVIWEVSNRHFILWGISAWVILLILTITSHKSIIKRMKHWWRPTHRSIYLLSLIAWTHYFLSTKETNLSPLYYLFVISILLLYRIIANYHSRFKNKHDDGLEAHR